MLICYAPRHARFIERQRHATRVGTAPRHDAEALRSCDIREYMALASSEIVAMPYTVGDYAPGRYDTAFRRHDAFICRCRRCCLPYSYDDTPHAPRRA